jgi:hypothetical protein
LKQNNPYYLTKSKNQLEYTIMNKRNIHTLALKALQEAVYEVILELKKTGRPLSVWRSG